MYPYIHAYINTHKIHHYMWTPKASTRYANDFYEYKYVILVAILDFGIVEALLPRHRWKLYMS